MNNLIVKEVNFNGDNLIAVKEDSTGKVYTGVKWVCEGLGLDVRRQREKLHEHLTLQKGVSTLPLPSNGGIQETLAIELDFLPLWLATINPSLVKDGIKGKLVEYQLKAKDILSAVFVKRPKDSMQIVNLIHQEVGELIAATTEIENRVAKLEEEDFIKPFQKKALINARTKKVLSLCGGKRSQTYQNKSFRSRVYQDIFRNIKNIYNVNEYDAIPKPKFNEALNLINEYTLPLELKYELEQINSQLRLNEGVC